MDVFNLREKLVADYRGYAESFLTIKDERIREHVRRELDQGLLWPDPALQLNPAFASGGLIEELVQRDELHPECARIFRAGKETGLSSDGAPLRLHKHQADAIAAAREGVNYVLTTGTGSGKSLAYIVPIVDHVLRAREAEGSSARNAIRAIVVYPMNALANSQEEELRKFLQHGYPDGRGPVSFRRYTGQELEEQREEIRAHPPDILLTNYVMLEYILTRPHDAPLVRAAEGLSFLVLDELHTYRGRQGSDVALLVRRVRDACRAQNLRCIGTSATLAGPGTFAEQRAEIAGVAERLFGAPLSQQHVIGETLRPATVEVDTADPGFLGSLRERVGAGSAPDTYEATVADPLACWIERTLGIEYDATEARYERCDPLPIEGKDGAAGRLARATGLDVPRCVEALREALMVGSDTKDGDGFPVFAFRLHQFFGGGSPVGASLAPEHERYISTSGQLYVPGEREHVMLSLAFCRECGQEYFPVRLRETGRGQVVETREISDRTTGENELNGFFYYSSTHPWPDRDDPDLLTRVPDDWLDPGTAAVRDSRRARLPFPMTLDAVGRVAQTGLSGHFVPAPFGFCLSCGVSYAATSQADFGKLGILGAGGRSTSTTVLGLTAVRWLRHDGTLEPEARKLLSFSDNRQDASLQAGHFNDFVEIGLLRSALHRAVGGAASDGLRHDALAQAVFDELRLDASEYVADPDLRGPAKRGTDEVLREVLAYRIYRDQQRGWRLTSPNLEQVGLLQIDYEGLAECCADEEVWNRELPLWVAPEGEPSDRYAHPALLQATVAEREKVACTLLDHMRRELAIKVDALDPAKQEALKQRASQRLIGAWSIDENERLASAVTLFPRPRSGEDERSNSVFLSPRGGFGQYLARRDTFAMQRDRLPMRDRAQIIAGMLEALRVYGLVEIVSAGGEESSVPGYRLQAAQLIWRAADGSRAFHDPIRIPQAPVAGRRTNPFFKDLYRDVAQDGQGIQAREHTAQVMPEERERREHRFREGRLPVLFCSPTMELGVDIASLNVVNMRNVPPTPANYAQRSGRAGRSGQPAFVYTFCSSWNSHDQYFFRRPARMVSGQVAPPQLDLANEDLVRAHVHAIWLSETGADMKSSLTEILETDGQDPTLELREEIRIAVDRESVKQRARVRAEQVLSSIGAELEQCDWWSPAWLERVLDSAAAQLDRACERWRGLFRSARATMQIQNAVLSDATRSLKDKQDARRVRREAETQLELLASSSQRTSQADFYSYRYLASEGFLPGYNFPRLPLAAYIPGRGTRGSERDEFVQRPRFLAITEFGPRSIIYHEGSQYEVNRVILPIPEPGEERTLATERAKLCERCGHLHAIEQGGGPDLCERCGALLPEPLTALLRMQNVATRRRERINSDEEERRRQGYEVRTAVRFVAAGARAGHRTGEVTADGQQLARLDYGQAATIWRVNLGERRRADPAQLGFVLDVERGYWQRGDQIAPDPEVLGDDEPPARSAQRVIPFVEDHRNCLLLEPATELSEIQMASLQAALKRGIQAVFQLEDQELAVEPLPNAQRRALVLFYESSEGGAGVLRRLLDDPRKLPEVARAALEICHFDPVSGDDSSHAPGVDERCEAACYDCLLSYGNQRDHPLLDRHAIRDVLLALARSTVTGSPTAQPPEVHQHTLLDRADSTLERAFVELLAAQGRRLPSASQELIADAACKPDFLYRDQMVAVFVDGPHHDLVEQRERDAETDARLEDLGWDVIRLRHDEDWQTLIDARADVFGLGANGGAGG